jgi:hypothetical protein
MADFDDGRSARPDERRALRPPDGRAGARAPACGRSSAAAVARLIEHAARLAERRPPAVAQHLRALADLLREADFHARRRAARSRAPDVEDALAGAGAARQPRMRERVLEESIPRHGADRHQRRARSGRSTAWSVIELGGSTLRPPDPDHRHRARIGERRRGRHRARGRARRADPLQGRADPVGLPGRALRRHHAAVAVGEPGVRAVVRCGRGRQRLAGRAVRAALGAGQVPVRQRSRSPARSTSSARCRRSAASTRRSRASSTCARRAA